MKNWKEIYEKLIMLNGEIFVLFLFSLNDQVIFFWKDGKVEAVFSFHRIGFGLVHFTSYLKSRIQSLEYPEIKKGDIYEHNTKNLKYLYQNFQLH